MAAAAHKIFSFYVTHFYAAAAANKICKQITIAIHQ
jgi:hypothetical protein